VNTVNRYECALRYARTANHEQGTGRPTRKRSKCCGAEFRVESGLYGLFAHSSVTGSATYRASEALSLHRTEKRANDAADKCELYSPDKLAIRFVTDLA
jgi:hypothetical protein